MQTQQHYYSCVLVQSFRQLLCFPFHVQQGRFVLSLIIQRSLSDYQNCCMKHECNKLTIAKSICKEDKLINFILFEQINQRYPVTSAQNSSCPLIKFCWWKLISNWKNKNWQILPFCECVFFFFFFVLCIYLLFPIDKLDIFVKDYMYTSYIDTLYKYKFWVLMKL